MALSQDLMNYDKMTQLALRGVVRDAIRRVIREDGLPGAHHFYITYLTRYPGVDMDESLAKKYEDEITIVLEHQYWDLAAHDDHFEVTLKFGGVPKYLSVPYTAITRFHDPSVGFAMQFDPPEEMQDAPPTLARLRPEPNSRPKAVPNPKPAPAATKVEKIKPATAKVETPIAKPKVETKPVKQPVKPPIKAPAIKTVPNDTPDDDGPKGGNTVVSLDAFRKK